jgi:hypothetical protein
MPDTAERFLDAWHPAVAARDATALDAPLADDVTLGAPPYWQKLEGRALVRFLLGLILETIEEFTYHREWVKDRELALEFTGKVDGLDLQGIDLVTLDADQRIATLDVLIRPANAVHALIARVAPRMQQHLAGERQA